MTAHNSLQVAYYSALYYIITCNINLLTKYLMRLSVSYYPQIHVSHVLRILFLFNVVHYTCTLQVILYTICIPLGQVLTCSVYDIKDYILLNDSKSFRLKILEVKSFDLNFIRLQLKINVSNYWKYLRHLLILTVQKD